MPEYTCIRCGRTYERKREKRNRLCYVCGYKQVEEEIRQLQTKEGPFYERWKRGVKGAKRGRKAC